MKLFNRELSQREIEGWVAVSVLFLFFSSLIFLAAVLSSGRS